MVIDELDEEEKEDMIRRGKAIKVPGDQRAQELGMDRHGNKYIHLRQFCGPDLRVYVQKAQEVWINACNFE
jgi:hypothetical protein